VSGIFLTIPTEQLFSFVSIARFITPARNARNIVDLLDVKFGVLCARLEQL